MTGRDLRPFSGYRIPGSPAEVREADAVPGGGLPAPSCRRHWDRGPASTRVFPTMPLDQVRIVLVRPEEPGNVGAAARAMKNFGLRHLVLVDPRLARPEKAYSFAHGAEEIVEAADLEPDLARAIATTHLAFATTRRRGRHRGEVRLLREGAAETASAAGPAAWVFGPESTGLSAAEVALCSDRVLIPTAPAHPSLNLAQAVVVCAYELHLAHLSVPRVLASSTAPVAERDALYAHLEEALLAVDFLNPENARARMGQLRRLLERARPSPREVRLLRGVARQVDWAGSNLPGRPGKGKRSQAARRSGVRRDSSS